MANRSEHAALLPTYKRYRKVLDRVMMPVAKRVDEAMLDAAATALGLLVDGKLAIVGGHDVAAVLDFALHELRADGQTVIQRHLADHPPDAGSQDDRVLRALEAARFSVFLIDGVEDGVGIHVYDMLGGPARFVFDAVYANPALLGDRFGGRLLTVDEVSLSTGVFLPLDQLAAEDILDELSDTFPERTIEDLHHLPPEDRTVVATIIARAGLEATDWMVAQALLDEIGLDPLAALDTVEGGADPLPLPDRAPPTSNPKSRKKRGKRR